MSSQVKRIEDVPEVTDLTVEQMFRGLPSVGLEDPSGRVTANALQAVRLPQAMLDAIRHY
jgi:hypothetical protein